MVAFDYLLFLLINVLSWSIPAWFVILSSILFLMTHAVLAQLEQAARLSSAKEDSCPTIIQRQSFLVECLPVLGTTFFFIALCWTELPNFIFNVQLLGFFMSTLKPLLAGLMLVQCEQRWADPNSALTDKLIALIPLLLFCVILPVVNYYDCFGLLNQSLLNEVQGFSMFILLTPLGMYTAKNGRFMRDTFDVQKFPKYLLGALVAMATILASNLSAILPLSTAFTLIPISQYICYALFLIPVVFHQTLTEEFMFRSIPLRLSEQKNTPWQLIPVIIGTATFLFAFHHIFNLQMGIALESLQKAMAKWLPPAIGYMFISLYSDDGVEYSSGMHFGWNLAISLTVPIMIATGGGTLGIWALFLSNMTIQIGQVGAVIGIEQLWHYAMGTSKDNTLPIHATTEDTVGADKLEHRHSSAPKTTVRDRLFGTSNNMGMTATT